MSNFLVHNIAMDCFCTRFWYEKSRILGNGLSCVNTCLKQILKNILILLQIIILTSGLFSSTAFASGSPAPPVGEAEIVQDRDADIIDTIIDILSSLTCETQGVGDLLRTEFSHTCIPASFFTFAVANLVSPGLYANTFLRLKINDKDLFPDACLRKNRIDYQDQKLSFALCNNILLAITRVEAIAKSVVPIASAIFSGEIPWEEIKNAWDIDPALFHEMYIDKREGDEGIMFDVGIIPVFPWKVIKENDRLCVGTVAFTGWVPIGCKYIKEPFPVSIYDEFLNRNPDETEFVENLALTKCSNLGGCYIRAAEASRTFQTITSPLIECVSEMIAKVSVSRSVCSFNDLNLIASSSLRDSSALYQFQLNMHRIVTSLLTIYVILFGIRMLLSGSILPKKDLINFVIKFLFVIYFSVGININPGTGDDTQRLDGMVQWVFPFMLNGMQQMSKWIIDASPSELCKFSESDYEPEMGHIALWDSLDCRVTHYLGLDMLQTIYVENAMGNHDWANFDFLSFPIPPYIYLLIPAALSGQPTLIMLAIMYPLMVISVAAFVVYMTIVCMICIAILGILAPLFVPMYLFSFTKGYFDSWAKLLISFMLQPMVAITFMTTMLSVYDYAFYGTCKYNYGNLSSEGRTIQIFYVDKDWSNYDSEQDVEDCRYSLGYMLNNPFAVIADTITTGTVATFPWLDPNESGTDGNARFDFMEAVKSTPGLIINMMDVVFELIRRLVLAMLTAFIVLYLMYHFSESITNFAADMTEGVSVSDMTAIGAQSIYKAGMAAVGAAGGAGGADGGGAGGLEGAADKVSTGGDAADKVSVGDRARGEAQDRVSSSAQSAMSGDDKDSAARQAVQASATMGQASSNESDEEDDSDIASSVKSSINQGDNDKE